MSKIVMAGGGQLGTMTLPLLARNPAVTDMILIDPQHFGAENLLTQNIDQDDVGEAKAIALARAAMRIRPKGDLNVRGVVDFVENVPWGQLRDADLMVGCVDSKRTRTWLNFLAFRLGI